MTPHHSRAFTLVEMMVGAAILSFVLALAVRFSTTLFHSTERQLTNRLVLQMESRKAADQIVEHLREGSEVLRPTPGETTNFLACTDAENNICLLYLEDDVAHSKSTKKKLYRLVFYTDRHLGRHDPTAEKVLADSLERLTFTCVSPFGVLVNATVANAHSSYQFLTHVGLMNLTDVE